MLAAEHSRLSPRIRKSGTRVAGYVRMSRSQYALVAGLVGVAVAFWQWRDRSASHVAHHRDHGEVIFSNTPHPSEP